MGKDQEGLEKLTGQGAWRRHWLHSEMWWPRLFRHQGAIAWDDYEKDYSDLPRRARQIKRTMIASSLP